MEKNGLRGSYLVRVDDKGRVKLPNKFRVAISDTYGHEVFVTSVTGDSCLVYPMPVWMELERAMGESSAHPSCAKFLGRANYYGQETEFDPLGRLLVPPRLRELAAITGDVDIVAHYDHLEIWNHQRVEAKMLRDPFTDDDALAIAQYRRLPPR